MCDIKTFHFLCFVDFIQNKFKKKHIEECVACELVHPVAQNFQIISNNSSFFIVECLFNDSKFLLTCRSRR